METLLLLSFAVDKFADGQQLLSQRVEAVSGVAMVADQRLVQPREAAQPRADGVHLTSPRPNLGLGPGLPLTQRRPLQVTF